MANMPVVNLPQGARGILLSASEWAFPNGTWTPTRVAGGNYTELKTAGAATTNPFINLSTSINRVQSGSINGPQGTEIQDGGLLTGFDLFYQITTAGLTSLTPTLYKTTLLNNAAPSVNASPGGIITAVSLLTAAGTTPIVGGVTPVASQTQPYAIRYQIATPYIVGANVSNLQDFLELAVVDPGSSVFALYGIGLLFNANR